MSLADEMREAQQRCGQSRVDLNEAHQRYLGALLTEMEEARQKVDWLQKEIDETEVALGGSSSLVNENQTAQKYKCLIAVAKKCFGGTVYEAWAKADHTVRVRFKQKQRELCDAKIAELSQQEELEPAL